MEKTGEKQSVKENETWPQWIAGIGVLLVMSHVGFIGVWSSPYINQLTSVGSPFLVTMVEMSWVVSIVNTGRPLGAIGAAIITNCWGSKTGVLTTCAPLTLCWLFIILADKVEWLYVARFSGGIAIGMAYGCYSLYLAEIAEPSNRGMLLAMAVSGIPCGNILISTLGAYFSMTESAAIALALCLVMTALFTWIPESPHHYVKNNQDDKARTSIRWYHRNCDVELELTKLHKFIEDRSGSSVRDCLKEMTATHFRKSVIVIGILATYTQMCGISTVAFYMETILMSAKLSVIEPSKMVMIVMAFGFFGSILSTFLMDKCGRKVLMAVSCAVIAFAFTLLTLNFHFLSYGFDPKSVESLSIVGMILYNLAAFLGAVPVPPTMSGEVFPPHLKCIATCIASIVGGISSFVMASTYEPLINLMTERYLFLFYAALLLTAVPFTIFFVPETKGMSLQEIQNQLGGKQKSSNDPKIILKENVAEEEIVKVSSIHGEVTCRDTVKMPIQYLYANTTFQL